MMALVIVACLASAPAQCRAEASAERWAVPMGCQVAAMQAAPAFEAANPGWRVREALCVPERRLGDVLARINGVDA